MLKPGCVALLLALTCVPAYAADAKPSEESIRQLLAVTDARKLLDSVYGQLDAMMKNGMQQALGNQTLTPEQQATIDNMEAQLVAAFKEELSWDKLEPLYFRVYRDSFTQEEIDGMLAFYKSPTGQAVIKKMPVVLQNTMLEMQKRMGPLFERIRKSQEDTVAQMKAQATKN